jgi:hypothetical protein
MSFIECINAHAKKGFLPEKKAKELNEEYEKLFARYRESMGDEGAAHAAAEHFTNIQRNIIYKKLENEAGHVLALKTVRQELSDAAAKIQAEADKGAKWMRSVHGDPYVRATRDKLESVYDRSNSIERDFLISVGDIVETYRSKSAGFKQDIEGFTQVVREALGQSTGNDAARAYGRAVNEMFTKIRQQFEEAGGIIGKINNYFPVHHEAELVGRVSYDEWAGFIKPLLDRDNMIDLNTGFPFDDARLDAVMRESYENIRTNGLTDIAEAAAKGSGMVMGRGGDISMRRTQSRFFHFKDADSFLAYNSKFGNGDAGLFDSMMGHVSSMARDIAIMQKLGPKPAAVMNNINLELEARGAGLVQRASVKGMYDVLSGKGSYSGKLASGYKFIQGWLNVKRSAYLGSAPISALSDTFFVSLAAKMNGLPAVDTMGQYFKLLNPADKTDRDVARHLFYVASAASGNSLQGARFADDVGRGGVTAWMAGVTNRASGLAAMTDAGRQAIMMTHGRSMAMYKAAGTTWDALEDGFREAAGKYGIGPEDWNIILKSELTTHPDMPDVSWLLPENVAALGKDSLEASQKYSDWMVAVGNLAVNEPKLMTRAITTGAIMGDSRQGSLQRLMASNVFFAKSYPITIIINQLLPALRSASQGRVGHLAAMTVGATAMGALAIQTRHFIQGKTEREMDGKFWAAAALQGGGLGLFGDFMFADYNRYGGSPFGTVLGPVVGTAEQMMRAGDLYSLAEGDWDINDFGVGAFNVAKKEIPGVNLWYSRLVVERMILDQAEKAIDPSFDSRMIRLEKKMQKEYGQKYWWRRGKVAPENR